MSTPLCLKQLNWLMILHWRIKVVYQRRAFGLIGKMHGDNNCGRSITPSVVLSFCLVYCVSLHLNGDLMVPECVINVMWRVIRRTSVLCWSQDRLSSSLLCRSLWLASTMLHSTVLEQRLLCDFVWISWRWMCYHGNSIWWWVMSCRM